VFVGQSFIGSFSLGPFFFLFKVVDLTLQIFLFDRPFLRQMYYLYVFCLCFGIQLLVDFHLLQEVCLSYPRQDFGNQLMSVLLMVRQIIRGNFSLILVRRGSPGVCLRSTEGEKEIHLFPTQDHLNQSDR